MGLFGFLKKKPPAYTYKMLFSSPFNDERDRQIKALALKRLADAGAHVSKTNTKVTGPGAISEFTGEPGESIVITNDALDGRTSFMIDFGRCILKSRIPWVLGSPFRGRIFPVLRRIA